MIPGCVALEKDLPPRDFSAFPAIEMDFVAATYLVDGVPHDVLDLIGGPDFDAGALTGDGLALGALVNPGVYVAAIGPLFRALRDGLVAGCSLIVEWRLIHNGAGANFSGRMVDALYDPADAGSSDGLALFASTSFAGIELSDDDDVFVRRNVSFIPAPGRMRVAVNIAERTAPANWRFAVSYLGSPVTAQGVNHPLLPRLARTIRLFGVAEYGEQPGEWYVRKFILGPPLSNSELVAFSVPSNAAGLAAETDQAQALTAVRRYAAGLAGETDTAFTAAWSRAVHLGLASESDVAFALGLVELLTLASETDTAMAIARAKTLAAGLASATDSAFAVAAVTAPRLLLESGDKLLLEDGSSFLLLE